MTKSQLQRAIEAGLQPTGDLFDELDQLPDYPIRSRDDARAICGALSRYPFPQKRRRAPFLSPVAALVGLFQAVDSFDCPAFEVFCEEGMPELTRIYDAMRQDPTCRDSSDPLFILKILAMYASPEATPRIVQAARDGFHANDYIWQVILSIYSDGHPERGRLFEGLRDPLPQGFMAVAFLDAVNEAVLEESLQRHPFNSPRGKELLLKFLTSSNSAETSYAQSATAALPFIGNPERDQLLALAMDHPDQDVQMEAVWAAAKLGSSGGLKTLSRYCLELERSMRARNYLTELERDDMIPEAALEPDFQAKAEFSDWLLNPNELGCAPDELEVVDHRVLKWPLDDEEKPFWTMKYRLRDRTGLGQDDVGYGVVGSVIQCHAGYETGALLPEDLYAIHCYWEAEDAGLIRELEPEDPSEFARMSAQWPSGPSELGEIVRIAELAPQLNYPQRLVALATGRREQEEGWVVLDGRRSRWYPRSEWTSDLELDSDSEDFGILAIHVGRQLLGFEPETERLPRPPAEPVRRPPEQIVKAYEALMAEWTTASPQRKRELIIDVQSPLGEYFPAYVEAKARLTGRSESECLVETYRTLLSWALTGGDLPVRVALDNFSPVGNNFRLYVHALMSLGDRDAVREVITLFTPYWDNSLGCCQLGLAAYVAQEWSLAERFLSRLLAVQDEWYKGAEMSLLAELWFHQNRMDEARQLLLDCLAHLSREMATVPRGDRQPLKEWFQGHLTTLLRLFPEEGAALLRQQANISRSQRP
jgi:hypothetical protein